MSDKVHFYKDAAGEWRWRRVAPNGRIVADSGEGYVDLQNAREGAERALNSDVRWVVDEENEDG